MPFHHCDDINIKLISPIPVSNPTPHTANCHCGHPINSFCRACALAHQCCICYLSPDHNCELVNNTFLHWHSNTPANRLRGGVQTPEEPTRSLAPSPSSPIRKALHKLATRPLTPPPIECPCGHAPSDCIHCQTHERCCQCSYRPHYTQPYNPDCSVCSHLMSKCLTCADMKQCHQCLLRLTMPGSGSSTHLLKPNQPDPHYIGRAPSMSVDVPPPPSNPCHHCKHEMSTCTRCAINGMCCYCNPAAMKTEQDNTSVHHVVKTEHNDKLTVNDRLTPQRSPLPEVKPRPTAHRQRRIYRRRDFHSAPPFAGNFASLPGFLHPDDATIEPVVDTNNAYRFMSRGQMTVPMIQNAIERLLSTTTSWRTLGHLFADIFSSFTVIGDEDDIDNALLSICGVSEDAITRFANLLEAEASQQAYEADMANYDDQLNDWQTAAQMREGFLKDAEKTISSLEHQLNTACARIHDLSQQGAYQADPNAITHLQALLQSAKIKSDNDELKIKELVAEKTALETHIKSLQAKSSASRQPPKSPPTDKQNQVFWSFGADDAAKLAQATLATFPHMPLSDVFKTAIQTSQTAGPPPKAKNKRLTSQPANKSPFGIPGFERITEASFADIAKSVKAQTDLSVRRANPTWNMRETNKSIVKGPTSKGTPPSEVHIKIPRNQASEHLFATSGKSLTAAIVTLLNKALTKNISRLFTDNPLVEAKWSLRENLIIRCQNPINDDAKEALTSVLTAISDTPVAILSRPPTTTLKFVAVPKRNEDGSPVSHFDLINDLRAHPLWSDIAFIDGPKFLRPDAPEDSGIVIVTVQDNADGSVGKSLMNSAVYFSGGLRQCRRWVQRNEVRFCNTCQRWGHGSFLCRTNMIICSKCGGHHSYKHHEKHCATCEKGAGHICVPKCVNCSGPHFSNDRSCPFYTNRFNPAKIQAMQKEQRDARIAASTQAKKQNKVTKDGFTLVGKGKGKANDSSIRIDGMLVEPISPTEPTPIPMPL